MVISKDPDRSHDHDHGHDAGMDKEKEYARLSKAELIRRLMQRETLRAAGHDYALMQELAVHQEKIQAQNAQLLEMQRSVEQSLNRYADLYDFAPLAYASLDANGLIREINLTGAMLLGIERQYLIDKPLGTFIERQDHGRFLEHLRHCRQGERDESAQLRLRARGGRLFPAQLTTHRVSGNHERPGVVYRTAITDLSEHLRVAEERQAARLRESAALAAAETKDRLIAMVSHELRTPLSAVLLWAKILQIKLAAVPEPTHALEVIVRSAEAQRQLTDDLLDISRISSGKLRLQLGHVELDPLVTTAIESVLPAARAKGISIESDVAADIGVLWVDADRLRQVIWNLVSNAVKFTSPGGEVIVSAHRSTDQLDLSVSDTGQGIAPDLLPHVFEPFRQAESVITTRAHGGLGLGLAISKQLIEQHGGTIHVMSEGQGKGATFVVRLPLPTGTETSLLSADSSTASVTNIQQTALSGIHVLLVEDETATRTALETLLGGAGARLTAVSSAPAALEAFKRSRPDVVVSDIGMPEVDGYEFMQRLRGLEEAASQPRVPALALTAFAGSRDSERARAAGFDLHIAKPVEPAKLVTSLRRLTELAASRGGPAT